MMRRRLQLFKHVFYLLVALSLGLSLSCAGTGDKEKVSFNQEFSLQIGHSAQAGQGELEIKFVKVTEDSRCPRGATCIRAGQVSCEVLITGRGFSSSLTITEPGLTDNPNQTLYKNYRLKYHVQPYPELNKKISTEEYKLTLTIEKVS
jgi:hypothetical protein